MKILKKKMIMNSDDYKSLIDTMREYKDADDKPQIGIFWYSPEKDELVDVYLQDFDSVAPTPNGRRISTKIHQKVWEKNYYRARAKNDKEKLAYYEQDYAWVPRGRVNFSEKDCRFEVMTGDWFDRYAGLGEEIIEMFQLPPEKTVFLKGEHCQLGHGWSEDLYK